MTKNNCILLGNKLNEIRLAHKLSIEQVSALTNLRTDVLKSLENGEFWPPVTVLHHLRKAYGNQAMHHYLTLCILEIIPKADAESFAKAVDEHIDRVYGDK